MKRYLSLVLLLHLFFSSSAQDELINYFNKLSDKRLFPHMGNKFQHFQSNNMQLKTNGTEILNFSLLGQLYPYQKENPCGCKCYDNETKKIKNVCNICHYKGKIYKCCKYRLSKTRRIPCDEIER
uniref:Uncharacterized protein n=1 Tax=Lepeophtheirus salmonis TaxID=72036 RepID=A0A0K2V280_LEPSM